MIRQGFLLLSLVFLLTACTVQKEKEDLSFLGKLYHNTTSRYNGYFNADILLQESIAALNQDYIEDYDTLIPVYPYMANRNVENQYANLDLVVEKVTTVSALHPQSHWLDDNYLMMGKANFVKKDYKASAAAFQYLTNNFDPIDLEEETIERSGRNEKERREKISRETYKKREDLRKEREKEIKERRKKRKKKSRRNNTRRGNKERPTEEEKQEEIPQMAPEDEEEKSNNEELLASNSNTPPFPTGEWILPAEPDPESYAFKHKPAYQEGQLWQARTWTAQENYFSAQARLTDLIKNPKTFPTIRNEAIIALIDNYIKSKQFSEAVTAIDQALKRNIDKSQKIRLAFLAGQIKSSQNNNSEAIEYFEIVRDLKPRYETDFYAQLSILKLGGGDLVKGLEKMLKNENNAEYAGEIYYTMGTLQMDNGQFKEGINTLKKISSLEIKSKPKTQANAYYTIADYYYKNDQYLPSKNYFDSTLTVLAEGDSRFKRVKGLASKLTTVAKAQQAIELQDSLLRISAYSDAEKKALALKIKKESLKNQNEQNASQSKSAPQPISQSRFGNSGQATSTFFAYDENKIKKGQKSFEKTWGNRSLEDNWRTSGQGSFSVDIEGEAGEGRTISFGISETEIDEILKDVPETEEEKSKSKNIINGSLLEMGFSFRSDLDKLDKSNETLLKLIENQPPREMEAEALYILYMNEKEMGNSAKAEMYKKRFDKSFSDTDIAKNILNSSRPDLGKETVAESAYQRMMRSYNNEDYESVIEMTDQAMNMFKDDKLYLPKFSMLGALATGKTQGRDSYIEKLKYVVANYPNSEEGQQARNYLQILDAGVNTNITSAQNSTGEGVFSEKVKNIPHYLLVTVPSASVINDVKNNISNFNSTYYSNEDLTTTRVQISNSGKKEAALLIRRFNNQDEVLKYYDVVQKQSADFKKGLEIFTYPLSITNYRHIITGDRLDEYKRFLEKNYNIKF
ncbi:tetratricopeptide repeat protein [Membranihabitans maritimus]|uniref:type IX secretion system periplasmic lipoprotein PorW/SprE n=1 Tax=Membranihabitans maritimus TaxID=2904244 RepID=UPI001F48901C|nr:hypothetical protein [Membranihabitans maritimus]